MDFKRMGKSLLYPPIWVMLILSVISAGDILYNTCGNAVLAGALCAHGRHREKPNR